MKCHAMGLIYQCAMALRRTDPAYAYSLLEMANNLRLVMRGEATLEEWNATYVGADGEPFDIEKLLPGPVYPDEEDAMARKGERE